MSQDKRDIMIDRIKEKLTDYLNKYTTIISELKMQSSVSFTLENSRDKNSRDIISIYGHDIIYYTQNKKGLKELFSVHNLIFHNNDEIEEMLDRQSQELKNLLIFLEDKNGILKKELNKSLIQDRKDIDSSEMKKYEYENDINELLK